MIKLMLYATVIQKYLCMFEHVPLTRNTTGGPPMRAMAVDSFLMFPPL